MTGVYVETFHMVGCDEREAGDGWEMGDWRLGDARNSSQIWNLDVGIPSCWYQSSLAFKMWFIHCIETVDIFAVGKGRQSPCRIVKATVASRETAHGAALTGAWQARSGHGWMR